MNTARALFLLVAVLLPSAAARGDVFHMPGGQTSLEMVAVGDAANVADSTGYGAVPYAFQIGKYDVTLAQYTAFLNAVATTDDPYGLYNRNMATSWANFGIAQNGSPGSYSYAITGTATGRANMPVFDVTWGDAARFCNWLQNGQPSGAEGDGTTETGAYTMNGATSDTALMAVTRNAGATYFIPTYNERYKAAYYKGGGTNAGYWLYPTQSNIAPSNALSMIDTNNANYFISGYTDTTNYLTTVGYFAGSPGPYGTYDMGGDVWQWNETPISVGASTGRGFSGGSFCYAKYSLSSSCYAYHDPSNNYDNIGFRVASVPEPGSITLLVVGAVTLLACAWRQRKRAG